MRAYTSYTVSRTVIPLARPFLDKTTLKMKYPLIKSSKWAGVAPVAGIDEIPDPRIQYNLLTEIVSGIQDKKDSFNINNINGAFSEIGRILNLHLAAGVPKKNMHVVAIVHAAALNSLLNNQSYRNKYGVDNPNLPLLKELHDAGVKLIACGQAMYFLNIQKEQMIPGVKVSLTAQTVLSSYQLRNYVHYKF
jgi:intracellular sulfur oxidation DsrE/DsrF family protein